MNLWHIIRTGWALIGKSERRGALWGLALFCTSALAASAMMVALFTFLAVLAEPSRLDQMELATRIGSVLGLETPRQYVMALGLGSIVVILVANGLMILRGFFISRFCAFFVSRLGQRMLRHYLFQPYPFFLEHHSGDLATNVLAEVDQVSEMYLRPSAEFISSALTVVAVVVTLLLIDPLVAGLGLLLIAGFYVGVLLASRRLAARWGARRMASNTERFRITSEAIGGIKDLKLGGLEASYVARFAAPAETIADASAKISIISETPRYAMQTLAFGGIIILCLLLMGQDEVGATTGFGVLLPALGMLALAAQRLSPELHTIYGSIMRLQFAGPIVDHLSTTLSNPPVSWAGSDAAQAPPLRLTRSLDLEGLSYHYANAEFAGVEGVTCSIDVGETIGIVGSTGAGKTTLADVILGLLPPQAGSMRVDDQEIDGRNVRAWQRSISYVPQDIFLTDASLRENIALGIEPAEIDETRVQSAARIAHLHEFITADLPNGYDTRAGERGVRLSGGQRQRIGIARALYRESDLLVLDEATSALDTVTEGKVLRGIESLPTRKTIIMIAHRLSTLRNCSRLLIMERGKVVGIGSWEELSATSRAFKELIRHAETGMAKVAE